MNKFSKLLVYGSVLMATFTKEVAEREVVAWRRFFALRRMLCNNKVALKYRFRWLSHVSCRLCIGVLEAGY